MDHQDTLFLQEAFINGQLVISLNSVQHGTRLDKSWARERESVNKQNVWLQRIQRQRNKIYLLHFSSFVFSFSGK